MLYDSAFLLIIGLLLAGLIHLFLNESLLQKLLVGSKNKVVLKAAILGIPLPLCSCSVLPMAHQLRKNGLNKGATASFLISTPETGVDSILLTYSLTDPILTVARPVAAFLTAMTTGVLINKYDVETTPKIIETENCSSSCCAAPEANNLTIRDKIVSVIKYSMQTVLKDLAPFLLLGYLLAGLVAVLLGDTFTNIPEYLTSGWGGYVGAVLVGLPLYICATSSTPLAAALLAVGFSPGAILVFLLVGPATNIASLTVIMNLLKRKSLLIYLGNLIIVSIFCGICVDYIYSYFSISTIYLSGEHHEAFAIVSHLSAILIVIAIAYYTMIALAKRIRKF